MPFVRLPALLALACLAASGVAHAGPLKQWVDKDGVVQLADGKGAASVCNWTDPKTGALYPGTRWKDRSGASHCTLGPSPAAREMASKLEIQPEATRAPTKVHETSAFDQHIALAAAKYAIPSELVRAIIVAESNFDPQAVSRVGAKGLMQLMPATAAEMYVEDLADPEQNIHGGTRYLRVLANMFGGDLVKTIAAYNAGPEAVKKAGGVPSFAETQAYVKRVVKLYRIYKGLGA